MPAPTFWDGYWKSLKPLEVEEPIDVYVHRPVAYLLARALLPTPVSPNLVTLGSILLGLSSAALMLQRFPNHLLFAGVALFFSAVFDCADGQLARLRGTSSPFGRVLDGFADLIVSSVVVTGSTYLVWAKYSQESLWHGVIGVALCVATIVTGSFHTTTYDHYKNLFLRITHPTYREGDDIQSAVSRAQAAGDDARGWRSLAWAMYLFYVRGQADVLRGFDPFTVTTHSSLPPYEARYAEVYRKHCARTMRLFRSLFGFGSLVFGISVSVALGVVDWYMLFRLVVLNGFFYGYMRPVQRAASRAAFEEMARLSGSGTLPAQ